MNLFEVFNIKKESNIITGIPQEDSTIIILEKYRDKNRNDLDLIYDYLFFESYKRYENDSFRISDKEKNRFDTILELFDNICNLDISVYNDLINKHYIELTKSHNVCKNEIIKLACKNGVEDSVIKHLVKNFSLDIFIPNNFSNYVDFFKKNPEILEVWLDKILKTNICFTDVNSLTINLEKLKSPILSKILEIFEIKIIDEFRALTSNELTGTELDQYYYLYKTFHKVWLEYLMKEKSKNVYDFKQLENNVIEKFNTVIEKYGQTINYKIDNTELMDLIKQDICTFGVIMHEYTHDPLTSDSIFKVLSDVETSIFEIFNDTYNKNSFFTYSRKNKLEEIMFLMENVFSHLIFSEIEEFEKSVSSYLSYIDICYSINEDYNIRDDYRVLFDMLHILSKKDEKSKLLNKISVANYYGPTMFICSLIEKTLRNFYLYIRKDIDFTNSKSITLNSLLSEENQEIYCLLGKEQLMVIKYYLLFDNNNQGLNIRNSIAHLDFDVNNELIFRYFIISIVLLFSVVSSIILYEIDNENLVTS